MSDEDLPTLLGWQQGAHNRHEVPGSSRSTAILIDDEPARNNQLAIYDDSHAAAPAGPLFQYAALSPRSPSRYYADPPSTALSPPSPSQYYTDSPSQSPRGSPVLFS